MMTSESTTLALTDAGLPTTRDHDGHDVAPVEEYLDALAQRSRAERYSPGLDSLRGRALAWRREADGTVVVALAADRLDAELAEMVYRFRLAQFLQIGLMDRALAASQRLTREPADDSALHALVFAPSGELVGYLALVTAPVTAGGIPLDAPGRYRFPVEVAHHVDLVTRFGAPDLTVDRVWELKRFVRARHLPYGPLRDRVSWYLITVLARYLLTIGGAHLLVGDSREDGAIRHFRLIGFDPLILPDTVPSLPRTALMWISYHRPDRAVPFAARMPDSMAATVDLVEDRLAAPHSDRWQRDLVRALLVRAAS